MRTTVTLHDRHEDQLDAIMNEMDEDDPGKSEAVRRIFDGAAEADDLRDQIDELRNQVDELRSQLAAANTRIDAANEIVEYVEEERAVQSRREWREEKQAHAGLASRLKWTLIGMPEPPEDVEATP